MALFNGGNDEQKQKKKQTEKILDELVGGLMPTSARRAFFKRMYSKGIKGTKQERVRSKVLKTIKNEVENDELEPTKEAINQRIEEILDENSDLRGSQNGHGPLSKAEIKAMSEKRKFEEKFGVDLTGRQWFKCSIEEVKYSTFSNQPKRNFDNAYVIVNEDNFEIIKESVWLKTNMGSRKLFFDNITSIDYDARGRLHASSSIIINTKSAEHIQLKFVVQENFTLMNNAFESYIEKARRPQQNISTTSDADELLKYAELFEKGLLTKEEFEMKKAELFSGEPLEPKVVEENPKPKYCGNCGATIDEDSNFCVKCGAKILK